MNTTEKIGLIAQAFTKITFKQIASSGERIKKKTKNTSRQLVYRLP